MVIFVDELNIHKLSPKWYFCKKRGITLVLVLFDTVTRDLKMVLSDCFVFQTLTLTKMVTKMGFRQNGTFASKKEADDEEIGYHLVGPGLYSVWL